MLGNSKKQGGRFKNHDTGTGRVLTFNNGKSITLILFHHKKGITLTKYLKNDNSHSTKNLKILNLQFVNSGYCKGNRGSNFKWRKF